MVDMGVLEDYVSSKKTERLLVANNKKSLENLLNELRYPRPFKFVDSLNVLLKDTKVNQFLRESILLDTSVVLCLKNSFEIRYEDHDYVVMENYLLDNNHVSYMCVSSSGHLFVKRASPFGFYYDVVDTMIKQEILQRVNAARKIQKRVKDWLWRPHYRSGRIGYHARKILDDIGASTPVLKLPNLEAP